MSKPLSFICPHCKQPALAEAKGQAIWSGRDDEGDMISPPTEWTMVQCDRCQHPTLHLREDYGDGFDFYAPPVVVYPAPQQISPLVPEPLRREWAEARKCLDATAYAACVVMVRRTLEGTCKDQGVTKKNLAAGLKELESKGLIDATLAEWAHTLRASGNQGAHFTGNAVPREDAEDSLAFAEALLDHLYVLRKRFDLFKQRLGK
jgi:hypothetical protein